MHSDPSNEAWSPTESERLQICLELFDQIGDQIDASNASWSPTESGFKSLVVSF